MPISAITVDKPDWQPHVVGVLSRDIVVRRIFDADFRDDSFGFFDYEPVLQQLASERSRELWFLAMGRPKEQTKLQRRGVERTKAPKLFCGANDTTIWSLTNRLGEQGSGSFVFYSAVMIREQDAPRLAEELKQNKCWLPQDNDISTVTAELLDTVLGYGSLCVPTRTSDACAPVVLLFLESRA